MAKYDVTYACGHEGVEDITGTNVNGEREKQVKWIEENRVCYDCYMAEQMADYDEVEMHYGEYKENYSDCKTKKGSYDKSDKTIIVYVPKAKEQEEEEEKITIEQIAEQALSPVEEIEKLVKMPIAEIKEKLQKVEESKLPDGAKKQIREMVAMALKYKEQNQID